MSAWTESGEELLGDMHLPGTGRYIQWLFIFHIIDSEKTGISTRAGVQVLEKLLCFSFNRACLAASKSRAC